MQPVGHHGPLLVALPGAEDERGRGRERAREGGREGGRVKTTRTDHGIALTSSALERQDPTNEGGAVPLPPS